MVYGKMVNTYRFTSLPCNLLHTVNPLLSPPGAYLFQAHLRGGLFNLQTTMVSVLHKELEYKVDKLKYKF